MPHKYKTESEMIQDFLANPEFIRHLPIPYPYDLRNPKEAGQVIAEWTKEPHIVEWKTELHVGQDVFDRSFVDIVAKTDFGEFVAIEAKLSVGEVLYKQAKMRAMAFPYVYVLIPPRRGNYGHRPSVSELFLDACESQGIGIITVAPWLEWTHSMKARVILTAKKQTRYEIPSFVKENIVRRWDNDIKANAKAGSPSPRMGRSEQIRRLLKGQEPMTFPEMADYLREHGVRVSEGSLRYLYSKMKGFKTKKVMGKKGRLVTVAWYEECHA